MAYGDQCIIKQRIVMIKSWPGFESTEAGFASSTRLVNSSGATPVSSASGSHCPSLGHCVVRRLLPLLLPLPLLAPLLLLLPLPLLRSLFHCRLTFLTGSQETLIKQLIIVLGAVRGYLASAKQVTSLFYSQSLSLIHVCLIQ